MKQNFKNAIFTALAFLALLWAIEILDRVLDLQLYHYGVYPQTVNGLPGILFGPLIHGSWGHLLSNSFALLILGTALLYGYPNSAKPVLLLIYLGSGICVWLFARSSYHFGASGLTHGMMFFIFTSGVLRHDRLSMALSMIVFFIYGSMIWTIFPQEPGISYESHFFGAAAGTLAAFLFRKRDPLPAGKTYDWEGESTELSSDNEPANHSQPPGPPAG